MPPTNLNQLSNRVNTLNKQLTQIITGDAGVLSGESLAVQQKLISLYTEYQALLQAYPRLLELPRMRRLLLLTLTRLYWEQLPTAEQDDYLTWLEEQINWHPQ